MLVEQFAPQKKSTKYIGIEVKLIFLTPRKNIKSKPQY